MIRKGKGFLASLLVLMLLACPGGAWASPADPAGEPPAQDLAQVRISREEAIAIARQVFAIPAELGEPSVGIQQSSESAVWTLSWTSGDRQPDRLYIDVWVDAATGRITSYSQWSTRLETLALPLTYTMDEAREVAEAWFAKLVPADLQPGLRFVENTLNAGYWGGTSYRFSWERVEQGYPVDGDGVSVAIDARTGDIIAYSLTWRDGLEFFLPEQILPREQAVDVLRRHLGMRLMYEYITEPGTDEGEWRLVYQPLSGLPYVDQEGRAIGDDGEPVKPAPDPVPVDFVQMPCRQPALPLDQETALQIARAAAGRTDPPARVGYSEQKGEPRAAEWSFTWSLDPQGELYVTVDAQSGVLTYVYSWTADEEPLKENEEPPVSRQAAEATALAFLRTHRPDLAGRVQYLPLAEDPLAWPGTRPPTHSFEFEKLAGGIPLVGQRISVEVDVRTGEVRAFWAARDPEGEEFPAAEGAVGAEAATDAYLAARGLGLRWVSLWSPELKRNLPPRLLWAPDNRVPVTSVDALTGAPLDYYGRDLIQASRRPSDIAGHPAEREIELLWSRGILDLEDGRFRPEEPATAGELARWIVLAEDLRPYPEADFGGMGAGDALARRLAGSAESPYFGAAMREGIILPADFPADFDPDGPVSRELFALWAIRAMGYGRVAAMDRAIEMPFTDAAQIGRRFANAVALLSGFGIVQGDAEGRFRPQEPVTRGDAARILYAVTAEPRY